MKTKYMFMITCVVQTDKSLKKGEMIQHNQGSPMEGMDPQNTLKDF